MILKKLIAPIRPFIYQVFVKRPWKYGYLDARNKLITQSINNESALQMFSIGEVHDYGIGFDERVIEYPLIFSRLANLQGRLLDAGSTLNFPHIIHNPILKRYETTIYTFFPEEYCFYENRVSYCFGDLRDLPFKDNLFDVIVSQSTIEHIDMDNSIYGYELPKSQKQEKSYDYIKAIEEYARVLKPKGTLIISVPFGKYSNYGFFQQFDLEMITKAKEVLVNGNFNVLYFKYSKGGWMKSDYEGCKDCVSYNPHTGVGKGDDGAAHSRAIAFIEWVKH